MLVVLALLPACSVITVKRPLPPSTECTSSRKAPTIDVALAVPLLLTAVISTVAIFTVDDDDRNPVIGVAGAAWIGTAAFTTSGGFGLYWTTRCRVVRAARERLGV